MARRKKSTSKDTTIGCLWLFVIAVVITVLATIADFIASNAEIVIISVAIFLAFVVAFWLSYKRIEKGEDDKIIDNPLTIFSEKNARAKLLKFDKDNSEKTDFPEQDKEAKEFIDKCHDSAVRDLIECDNEDEAEKIRGEFYLIDTFKDKMSDESYKYFESKESLYDIGPLKNFSIGKEAAPQKIENICLPKNSDPFLLMAIDCVLVAGMATTSLLQKKLKLGYIRAAKLLDKLEEMGIVGPFEGSKPRQILVTREQLMSMDFSNITSDSKFVPSTCITVTNNAIDVVLMAGFASPLLLHQRLNIRFLEAEKLIDELESTGIVSTPSVSNNRSILLKREQIEEKGIDIKKFDTCPQTGTNYDSMDGVEFEHFCAELLKKNGFINVEYTTGSGDYGVDILAEKDGITYAVQCKRQSTNVGNKAVQEVYSGRSFYGRNVGIVMTNQYYTSNAKTMAERTGIILWDREQIEKMM